MKRKGFTLVEMMAVIAVLGLLVVLVLPNVLKNYRDAKKVSFINEAKELYSAATDRYVLEKTKGKKIGLIQKEEDNVVNELALNEAGDLYYTIRLDSEGRVTAFKLSNAEYCIVGVGDFLGSYTKEDVIELSDEERAQECNVTVIQDNQKFILRLQNKETVKSDYSPKIIYLKYNVGWFSDNNLHNEISEVTIPYKENYYFSGTEVTNTVGSKIEAINCKGEIAQGADGGGIFTGKEEKPYVDGFSKFIKKYYQVAFTGGENSTGNITTVKCEYTKTDCKIPSNVDENGYGKDIKKTGYLFKGWTSSIGNYDTTHFDLPVITDSNENDYSSTIKFDNEKVCNGTQNIENTVTFNAVWEPIKYQVKYDCNGGSNPASNSNHTYDTASNLNANTCTRSGYSFLGWSTTATGNKEFDNSASVKNLTTVNNDVVTLYAVWSACGPGQYLAGNTCTACAKDYYSTELANASCTKCPDGYTTSSTGANTKTACTIKCAADYRVAEVDKKCVTKCSDGYNHEEHTIKAGEVSSNCSANKFTVAYDGNTSNDGKTDSHFCVYDDACVLKANGFKKTGNEFTGWKKNNTGTLYAAGASIKNTVTSGTATFFAQWNPCGKGRYLNGTACADCPKGKYSDESENAACKECPTGYATDVVAAQSQTACKIKCSVNKLVKNAKEQCTSCDSGYVHAEHTVAYGSKSTACTACGKGQYAADDGTCKNCAKGYYSTGTANASCTKCPDGYTTASEGSQSKSSCKISCSANTLVASKDAKCSSCDSGYAHEAHDVTAGNTSSSCTACGAGYYVATDGTCKKCAKGYYSTGTANASCTKCPDGYTTDSTGSTAKTACKITCAANTTVASKNAQCTACPDGTTNSGGTIIAGNTGPACEDNCPSGCSACSEGECVKCPAGQGLIKGKCVPITSNYEGTLVQMFDYEATENVGLWQFYKVEAANAGDKGGLPIPTSKVNVCVRGASCSYADTSAICWVHPDHRTVCNYKAATEICSYYTGYSVPGYTRMHSFNYLGGEPNGYDSMFDYGLAPGSGRTYGLHLCTSSGGGYLEKCPSTNGCEKSNNGNCYPMYVWYNNGTKASIAYPSPYGYQGNPVMILAGKNDEKLAISVRCAKK